MTAPTPRLAVTFRRAAPNYGVTGSPDNGT